MTSPRCSRSTSTVLAVALVTILALACAPATDAAEQCFCPCACETQGAKTTTEVTRTTTTTTRTTERQTKVVRSPLTIKMKGISKKQMDTPWYRRDVCKGYTSLLGIDLKVTQRALSSTRFLREPPSVRLNDVPITLRRSYVPSRK